ncbi:MAG: hypothetical protein RJA77_527, partial [Pseudomonadota bacterium]
MARFPSRFRLQRYLNVLIAGVLLWGFGTINAQPIERARPSATLHYLVDPDGTLTIDQVRAIDQAGGFRLWPSEKGTFSLGFVPHPVWVRLVVTASSASHTGYVIEVAESALNLIELHQLGKGTVRTGNRQPIESRPFIHRYFAFPVALNDEPTTLYFRLQSEYTLGFPFEIFSSEAFEQHRQTSNLLHSMYFGGLIILAVYNFFLALSLRDRRFIWYGLYAISINLAVFAGNGFGRIFIWPQAPAWDAVSSFFLLSITGFFATSFSQGFLQTKRLVPRIHLVLQLQRAMFLLLATALLLAMAGYLNGQWVFQAVSLNALICVSLFMGSSVVALRAKLPAIRFFVLAWSVLWLGVIVAALRQFDLIPTNSLTAFAVQIASGVELILLSLALADLIQQERQQRVRAQSTALEANRKRLTQHRDYEQRLEQTVKKKTAQLEDALRHERQLFEQLLRFGAMLSHEFRNPLGIIDSQASLIRRDPTLSADSQGRVETIKGAAGRLARLFDDWLKADQMDQSLADAFNPKQLDLLAWASEYAEKARVTRPSQVLSLRLPNAAIWVEADQRLLAIALDNLLDNAAKYCPPQLPVEVVITMTETDAVLSVIDCGPGIPLEDRPRVFDEYSRGSVNGDAEGSGLGLAVVRRIGEIHGGRIALRPSPDGLGCRFDLRLPRLKQPS